MGNSIYKINQMLSMVVGTDFSRLTQKRAGFVYNRLRECLDIVYFAESEKLLLKVLVDKGKS